MTVAHIIGLALAGYTGAAATITTSAVRTGKRATSRNGRT